MNTESTYKVVVIGAGQAGLATSYFLKKEGIRHIVLEQSTIGHAWKSQRWKSFKMNTPNWMTCLPGRDISLEKRESFMTKDEFSSYLESYAEQFQLPVMESHRVIGLRKEGKEFKIKIEHAGKTEIINTEIVVIASGIMNRIKFPELAKKKPENIVQLHASEYKTPHDIGEGNILVVGGAQSGCQIAEELALAGRKVYMAGSKVTRAPRRYQGKDIMEWMEMIGINDIPTAQLKINCHLNTTQPQSSGIGLLGHTISYQSLHKLGVTILGSLKDIENNVLHFENNCKEHIHFADEASVSIKKSIDLYLQNHPQIIAKKGKTDEADLPDELFEASSDITELSFEDAEITTVIWATGFGYDFSFMENRWLDEEGKPIHAEGKITNGLYCIGFPWLRKKKSGLVHGVKGDAEIIVQDILRQLRSENLPTP